MDYRQIAEEFCRIRIVNARKMEKIEKALSAKGEAHILMSLAERAGRNAAGELSKSSGLSVSRVTNILNSLEKKGLIRKRNDDADKRKVYVSLTQRGEAFISQKHEEVLRQYARVFQKFGEEDSKEYIRLLKKLSAIMDEEMDWKLLEEISQS